MPELDQFYTKDNIAEYCLGILLNYIDLDDYEYIIEPSAGKGAFFRRMPEDCRIGIDLDPKCEGIIECDFMEYEPPEGKILFLGNPPFGKNCSLAIKFFNRCALYGEVVAFIIPRTFKRVSVQNQLDLNFHLIHSEDLPIKPCCFEPKMDAKCCFQVWKRRDEMRERLILPRMHPHFHFLKYGELDANGQPTPPVGAHFVMKAYGSNCGEILDVGLENLRPKSWHWIVSNINPDDLKNRFMQLDYSISRDTVRQDSIGQQEVIKLYMDKFG